ncbi:DUF3618 domain-containing protein [Brevibacterium casei]|uniref:DUF3618 domain-containing protein n=1 Tax=Brevibacterium casei TaxID=33889 RepID=UPI0009281594|nr:DUF3618 domain-containing protein [Brevibacterium casei]SIK47677.1 Protein of uncharacterised function (DUF3618) [Mycobacteroides abscessus subsp. abscessus]MBE4696317.1 DUF3618 domain-containing protein [Brevibacterium casei]MBY3579439.1 DUF3618 domain-containing protein [Brevibacterium casei]QPR40232.1 DUF3618 domain-containing protein [Brevibacterium casei]QPR44388.1 DUF3618 domain-containing protein [Brevibacterium casei]
MADTNDTGPNASPSEIQADIARTREELGQTLAQLVERFDVKAQAEHTLDDVKDRAAGAIGDVRDKTENVVAGAKGAVKSVLSSDDAAGDSAGVTDPDEAIDSDLALRSRAGWTDLAPLVIASGLALAAVIVAVGWRR